MKNAPVATFILSVILKNIELSSKVDVTVDSLGQDVAKVTLEGMSQSNFVKTLMCKSPQEIDFSLDCSDLSATFEVYGFQLKVYAVSKNKCELVLRIPYSAENSYEDSLRRAVFKVIKENHNSEIDLNDITCIKRAFDGITYSVNDENMLDFFDKMCSKYELVEQKWHDDHKGREYRVVTLNLGLFNITINNNVEINYDVLINF